MRRLLWGLLPDGSSLTRIVRGLLLGAIGGALPLVSTDAPIDAHRLKIGAVVGAVGALAGWLRAGEPNDPKRLDSRPPGVEPDAPWPRK